MASDPKRFAIRRSSVDALSLPAFPDSLKRRDAKLAAELEEWRQNAQAQLYHSVSALKLDRSGGANGLTPDVIAYVQTIVSTLQADIANRLLRTGDQMNPNTALMSGRMPLAPEEFVNKAYVDGFVGLRLIIYGRGNPNGVVPGDFEGQFYSDLDNIGGGLFQRKATPYVWV